MVDEHHYFGHVTNLKSRLLRTSMKKQSLVHKKVAEEYRPLAWMLRLIIHVQVAVRDWQVKAVPPSLPSMMAEVCGCRV